jgi:hypothetical protein
MRLPHWPHQTAYYTSRSRAMIVQGRPSRTFASMVGFLALAFLCSGVYLLQDALAHPIAAQSAGLIVGAFVTVLAAILLFFICIPRKRARISDRDDIVCHAAQPRLSALARPQGPSPWTEHRTDLSFQRFYVDRTHIRP